MSELPFQYFDCDNHYYEALDAFTRHMEPEFARRTMQWATINGKQRLLVGGKVNKFIPNPTFDPVAKPGIMDEYFRGRNPKGEDARALFGELDPISPAYRDKDARLALMDEQGMGGAILLPTLGVGMEQALIHDIPAMTAAFRSFNRWMEEDWGFAYQDRIFAAPYITLSDPANAAREVEWALSKDARFVVMVGGPVTTIEGGKSPADPIFDPFWQQVNDAGITVLYHGGETAYTKLLKDWGESDFTEAFRMSAFRGLMSSDALQDTMASHLSNGLFRRFPNLRMASIEVGCSWAFHLFEKLTKSYGMVPHLYDEDPRETFRRHIWVSPFYEDKLDDLLDLVGEDHIVMGSDYPHAEGLVDPSTYSKDLQNFNYTDEQIRKVMLDNGRFLATPRPVG